jgi:hypothetical protein
LVRGGDCSWQTRGALFGECVIGRHRRMDSEAESVVRRAISAINDRTIQVQAAELLDSSIIRHDLVQRSPIATEPERGPTS